MAPRLLLTTVALNLLTCCLETNALPQLNFVEKSDGILLPPLAHESALNLEVLRRKEEMYLKTIKEILPALDSFKEELTEKMKSDAGVAEASNTADMKMLWIENKLLASQGLVRKFLKIHRQIAGITEQNHNLLASMNNIYERHSDAINFELPKNASEVLAQLKSLLAVTPYPTEKILQLLRSQNETSRTILLWILLGSIEITKENLQHSSLLISLVSEIKKINSSQLDTSALPKILQDLLSRELKILRSAKTGQNLIFEWNELKTTGDLTADVRSWEIIPVPESKSFLIHHANTDKYLGIKDSSREAVTVEDREYQEKVKLSIVVQTLEKPADALKFHWDILTGFGERSDIVYLEFMNVYYKQVLDSNFESNVYPHANNDGDYQNWKLL